jgi:2-polyprenyl-6-methoxyphenol hydroxylase-like FAD-dependent oxidoreductase
MALSDIFILGAGMCGVASALAISKTLSSHDAAKITVFELRDAPTTLGGPVNLTPSAQRHLDRLGVLKALDERGAGTEVNAIELFSIHSGRYLGCLDFTGSDGNGYGGYKGRRVMRQELLLAMLDAAKHLKNVQVLYGKKVIGLRESAEKMQVTFEDGESATADLVLGCDGIHSNTRMQFVEPDRVPVYSGISTAQGYVKARDVTSNIHFRETGMHMSSRGSLLTTYYDPGHEEIYLAAVTEAKDNLSRDGRRAKGADRELVTQDIMSRFGDGAFTCIREMVAGSADWFLFPVYALPPGGKWHTERVILLGDAAHAVSSLPRPQRNAC